MDKDLTKMFGFFLKIENSSFSTPSNQKSTIKYTKLPEHESISKVSWPQDNYKLQPRLRRTMALNENYVKTSRSLQHNITFLPKTMAAGLSRRKIVTISEDDENSLHPRFCKDLKKSSSMKTSNRSVEANLREDKRHPEKASSMVNTSRNMKDCKPSSRVNNPNNLFITKDLSVSKISTKTTRSNKKNIELNEIQNSKGKDLNWKSKHVYLPTKTTVTKNVMTTSECDQDRNLIKQKMNDQILKSNTLVKKLNQKSSQQNRSKEKFSKDNLGNNKSVIVIHVPLDAKCQKGTSKNIKYMINEDDLSKTKLKHLFQTDRGTDGEELTNVKNVCIDTDSLPQTKDQIPEVNKFDLKTVCKSIQTTNIQAEVLRDTFDNLVVPNVTLVNNKSESSEEIFHLKSKSLPSLQMPILSITPAKKQNNTNISVSNISKNTSYIIRQETVTYTSKKKINFHVMDNNDKTKYSHLSSSIPLAYPLNVVSVLKKKIMKKDSKHIKASKDVYEDKYEINQFMNKNYIDQFKVHKCSHVLNSNNLMKPSDIISTIGLNKGLLQSDSICEQFQKELHFIDSFFESLQYLENCSLCDNHFPDSRVENLIINSALYDSKSEEKNSEYRKLLCNLKYNADIDDMETMASKSLCLLNLLIRDEQRRAKNLLFALKMREDALKDFTKSQILWLENKKKHDNTALSTLKKKQRGALLKLQHECGEMQRMRKALLTLSEKRKIALIKTKKNIELKLKNNVNVDEIMLGKKKLKRNTDYTADRNIAPLKCFDLSSSGCEEYTASRQNLDTLLKVPNISTPFSHSRVRCVEKCIQTGDDSIIGYLLTEPSNTADENCVVVDGKYLNIVFHNLSLPQIFSGGKQYEVNEEALKNIVNSTNSVNSGFNDTKLIEKLMAQNKNNDLDRSSSPSTARSLVDEFDQYYKVLVEEEKLPSVTSTLSNEQPVVLYELKDTIVQTTESDAEKCDNQGQHNEFMVNTESLDIVSNSDKLFNSVELCACDASFNENDVTEESVELKHNMLLPGPLPVPVGESAQTDTKFADILTWSSPPKSSVTTNSSDTDTSSSQLLCGSVLSSLSLSSIVHNEAEELRRKQLAIEREIKALEQEQCRLLVVREIPDKPPPPYTPPMETRASKPPQMFITDEATNEKIHKLVTDPDDICLDPTDAFDIFLQDFCQESVDRQKSEHSEKPWDACNLLPQKSSIDNDKLANKTSSQLSEVLSGAVPTFASNVGARRSDQIDDILFNEWRRCEPEWTKLHADEAIVKNQVFESIFQKVLTETIDEYKRVVQSNAASE